MTKEKNKEKVEKGKVYTLRIIASPGEAPEITIEPFEEKDE